MATNTFRTNSFNTVFYKVHLNRGMVFGVIIIAALLSFEIFNYGTTEYALSDLLGDLEFLGLRWATILAIAFCGIDFAGIARLFTPESGPKVQNETWYLFGAWMLAACMNAMLTWWGVSLAILNHTPQGNAVIPHETMLRVVPIFVALLVWLIRVLIIGTFSVSGDRLFSMTGDSARTPARSIPAASPAVTNHQPARTSAPGKLIPMNGYRPAVLSPLPRSASSQSRARRTTYVESPTPPEPEETPSEPTYLPVAAMSAGRTAPAASKEGSLTHAPLPQRRF